MKIPWLIKRTGVALSLWLCLPEMYHTPEPMLLTDSELLELLTDYQITAVPFPSIQDPGPLRTLGKTWFFSKSFSQNQLISCNSCHKPEYDFSDSTPLSTGIGQTHRNAPSLIHAGWLHWFFWDGRADSLEMQALEPIEHPHEHGFTRSQLAHVMYQTYRPAYETQFGPLSQALTTLEGRPATPRRNPLKLPNTLSAYGIASVSSFRVMDQLLHHTTSDPSGSALKRLAAHGDLTPRWPEAYHTTWEAYSESMRMEINQVFWNFGRAIAAYERGIHTTPSAFDRFTKRALSSGHIPQSIGDGFGVQALRGAKLFFGSAQCSLCHRGPMFTDQQFHNTGLGVAQESLAQYVDIGRAGGIFYVQNSEFACKDNPTTESCREMPWLDTGNLETMGAFKTPSLRNVSRRPFLGHDGRFDSLRHILEHYNHLPDTAHIGHREESLRPLHLADEDLEALQRFLETLTGDLVGWQ